VHEFVKKPLRVHRNLKGWRALLYTSIAECRYYCTHTVCLL